LARLYKWTCDMIQDLRQEVKPPTTNGFAILGDYLNTYINNTLVCDDGLDQRSNMNALPRMLPKNELLIRMEPDTNKVFVTTKHFKKYCADNQISYKETINLLKSEGYFIGNMNKRLSKGMKITTPAVSCLCFDISDSEIAQNIIDSEDGNREGAV